MRRRVCTRLLPVPPCGAVAGVVWCGGVRVGWVATAGASPPQRRHSPPLHSVADANLRASFSAAAPDAALKISWAFWTWSPARPYPEWTAVLAAPLYQEAEYAGLRKVLMARLFRAVAAPGS